jgi:haloacetate dehalogenase
MSDWKTRAVLVGDLTLTVDVSAGPGIPILLLHGIPGWRGTWHAAGARLARRHAVVIPDLAGFGRTRARADGAA